MPGKKQGLCATSCFVTAVMLGHLVITPAAFFLRSRVAFAEGEEATTASSADATDATNDATESGSDSSSNSTEESGGASSNEASSGEADSGDAGPADSAGSPENAATENDSPDNASGAAEAAGAEQNTQQETAEGDSSGGSSQSLPPESSDSTAQENNENTPTPETAEPSAEGSESIQESCELDQTIPFNSCAIELACANTEECLVKHGCEVVQQCLLAANGVIGASSLLSGTNTASDPGANVLTADGLIPADSATLAEGTIPPGEPNAPTGDSEKSGESDSESDGSDSGEGSSGDDLKAGNLPADAGANANIGTGDATAAANDYNEVNINTIGQNILRLIFNIEGTEEGDVNLLEKFSELLELSKALLSAETYQSNDSADGTANIPVIDIENINQAVIANNVGATATSGANQITGTAGDASITTGDAIASANVVNVANQNYIGNTWLFAMINVYGSWLGDLILPGKDLLKVSGEGGYDVGEIENTNVAATENNVNATATSGANQITGTAGNASITTGDSYAQSGVVNQVNTNIVKDNWLFLLINNMGNWTGRIVNIDGGVFGDWYEFDFGLDESQDDTPDKDSAGIINVKNQNVAAVTNNVSASAVSGANSIDGTGGDAAIKTGDAFAMSRVLNFINNNIIGDNWLFSVVNVMGNWEGDAVFAYPDLELSISDNLEAARPGQQLNYTLRYKNVGHAPCDAVDVKMTLPQDALYHFDTGGGERTVSGNEITWRLPGLAAQEEGSFVVAMRLNDNIHHEVAAVAATASIKTGTTEKITGNNSTYDVTRIYWEQPSLNEAIQPDSSIDTLDDGNADEVENASIKLTRTVKTRGQDQSGYFVEHSIFLENNGNGPVYNIEVEDKVKNDGQKVISYIWNIGDLAKGKKIRIRYTVHIAAQFGGKYKNTAHALGYTEAGKKVKAEPASVEVKLAQDPALAQSYLEYYYYTDAFAGDGVIAEENQESQPAEIEESGALPNPADGSSAGGGLPAVKDRNYLLFVWLAAVAFTVLRFVGSTTLGRRSGKFAGALASRYAGLIGSRLKGYSEDATGNNTLE